LEWGPRKIEDFVGFIEMPVWQKAHKLVLDVYQLTASFPRDEVYGLTSQIRRASLSVSANIAEAFGRFQRMFNNCRDRSLDLSKEADRPEGLSLQGIHY